MKVKVQAVDFKVDQKLIDFVQKKMDKLDQFYDKIVDGGVSLKLGHKNEHSNKIAEVSVKVPGDVLVVKKQTKSFEESVDGCVESLKRMLRKKNEKVKAHAV
ncbi:MAG: ribosome-associated translation inhibitor RaiA [Flavobacteriales bacterium]|nr:ribosome-associated translation inhibitor RaiA [Flavobacteriales bacterium]